MSLSLAAASHRAARGIDARQVVPTAISFGPFTLYPSARFLERHGARLAVGSRALDILIVLTEHAGEVVSHKELLRRVWRGLVVTPSNLRVHIAGLRRTLCEGVGSARHIANVPGQGYCFVAPIRRLKFKELNLAAHEPSEPTPPLPDPHLDSTKGQPSTLSVALTGLAPTLCDAEACESDFPAWQIRSAVAELCAVVRKVLDDGRGTWDTRRRNSAGDRVNGDSRRRQRKPPLTRSKSRPSHQERG